MQRCAAASGEDIKVGRSVVRPRGVWIDGTVEKEVVERMGVQVTVVMMTKGWVVETWADGDGLGGTDGKERGHGQERRR